MPKSLIRNPSYFESIDTENKAYLLGYIAADGSINRHTNKLSFCIHPRDKMVLELLAKELDCDNKIAIREGLDTRTKRIYQSCNLQISSRKLKDDLISHTIGPDKTTSALFPNYIADELKWHFIRGMIDGDGFISNKKCMISLISTKECLQSIRELCEMQKIYWSDVIFPIKEDKNTWKMQLCNTRSNFEFLHRLYAPASIYLERKYDSAMSQLSILKNKGNTIRERIIRVTDPIGNTLMEFDNGLSCIEGINITEGKLYDCLRYGKSYRGFLLERGRFIHKKILIL